LTTSSRDLLEELTVPQIFKKFLVCCGTRKFIPVFTRVRHRIYLAQGRIKSTSSLTKSLKSSLIFASVYTCLSQAISFLEIYSRLLHISLSPTHAKYLALLIFLDWVILIIIREEQRS
jgi:hypothetical protein